MRTWRRALVTAVVALGVSGVATAGSIDVDFTGTSGAGPCSGSSCTAAIGDVVTLNIVLNTVLGDTQMGGAGSAYQISLDTGATASAATGGNTPPAGWFPAGAVAIGAGFTGGAFNGLDLFGTNLLTMGSSYTIGSVTLTVGGLGVVNTSLLGAGDSIIGSGGGVVSGEYALNGGSIIPEPTTASLMGLGLIGLSFVGRRRN